MLPKGKSSKIYPKKPSGRYHQYRIWVAVFLLLVFFSGPFIKVGSQPLFLLNFFDRKFIILGSVFWPHDTYLLFFVLLALVLFIILFTVLMGRIWCGWACPQTIFMELVFRKIEYWIEGDANAQQKLDARKWDSDKVWRKTLKHFVFLVISLAVGHTFMAYLVGVDEVIHIVGNSPLDNITGFTAMVGFTVTFYLIFTKVREKACTAICPYGRLQSVLLDKDSIVIAYDHLRGEPRGKLKKAITAIDKGDCIDCTLCVQVCPTGIDIRNGTQLECVNCTACIDACDDVMQKIGLSTGLIRYDSHNGIENQKRRSWLSVRPLSYMIILFVVLGILAGLLISRKEVDMVFTRVPGMTFQLTQDGRVSNMYRLDLINKTFDEKKLEIKTGLENAEVNLVGEHDLVLPSQGKKSTMVVITLPQHLLKTTKTRLPVYLYYENEIIGKVETSFTGPVKRN
jgi:cytochrome c oxidase accessory protein FixG